MHHCQPTPMNAAYPGSEAVGHPVRISAQACQCMCLHPFHQVYCNPEEGQKKKPHTHKKTQTKAAPHLPSKPSALVKDARPTAWEPNIFPLSSQQLPQSSTNPPLPSELKSAWLLGWGEERQIHSLWDRAAQPRGCSAWLSAQPGTSELEAGSRRYVSSFHLG